MIVYQDHFRAAKRRELKARTQRSAARRGENARIASCSGSRSALDHADAARLHAGGGAAECVVRALAKAGSALRCVAAQSDRTGGATRAAGREHASHRKDRQPVRAAYGHKINLAMGHSDLVLYVVVEAGISYPKRRFGLARCHWRSLARFKA